MHDIVVAQVVAGGHRRLGVEALARRACLAIEDAPGISNLEGYELEENGTELLDMPDADDSAKPAPLHVPVRARALERCLCLLDGYRHGRRRDGRAPGRHGSRGA